MKYPSRGMAPGFYFRSDFLIILLLLLIIFLFCHGFFPIGWDISLGSCWMKISEISTSSKACRCFPWWGGIVWLFIFCTNRCCYSFAACCLSIIEKFGPDFFSAEANVCKKKTGFCFAAKLAACVCSVKDLISTTLIFCFKYKLH